MPAHMKRPLRPWVLLGVLVLLLLAAALAVTAIITASNTSGQITAKDMRGHAVTVDPGSPVSPRDTVTADTGTRFQVPSVHLNVPLGAITPTNGQITPPGFTSAYEIRTIGTTPDKPDQGTVFVIMHALRNGGTAPGNYLTDINKGTSRLTPGATITVADTTYTVTGSRNIPKQELPADTTTWANTPNRLVIITCLERPDNSPSTHNTIITATHR